MDIKIKCKSYLVAPVAENYFLGTIDIYSENNLITSTKILTSYKINRKGIFDYLEETGQTHTQNKFIASLKKVFNQIETKGIE